jgi:hypothetical protein
LAQWEQPGKKKKERRKKEEERKNARKQLTLTGLLMEGVKLDTLRLAGMRIPSAA